MSELDLQRQIDALKTQIDYLTALERFGGLTSGRVVLVGASGVLTDDADLTFDGIQLQLASTSTSGGILIGGDVQLYRSAANVLRTPDSLVVDGSVSASSITASGVIAAGGVLRASGATATGVKSQESTIANNAAAALLSATDRGVLIVTDSTQATAIFIIAGTFHDVKEVSDPYTVYSAAAGTASSTNVYWSAANSRYEIENKRGGGSVTYNITLIGAA